MRDYAELILDLRRHHCDAKEDDTQEVCEECAYDVIVADKSKFNGITDVCTCGLMHRAADAIEELIARDVVPMDFHERCLQLEIKKRIELEKQLPQWISVEERLPEDQGDDARAARGGDYIHKVLAASVTPNYTVMDTAYLENGIWSLSQYTSWKQIIGAPVTHWMPLPEPPKEYV